MTASDVEVDDPAAALLRRLPGRVPPEALALARSALARRDDDALARLLTQQALTEGVPLLPDEHAWLAVVIAPYLPEVVDVLPGPVEQLPGPSVHLEPADGDAEDEVVDALVERVRAVPGVVGVWHAVASSPWRAAWPPPRGFVVVEAGSEDGVEDVLAAVDAVVVSAAGPPPHVAVLGPGGPTTPHAAAAQLDGALVWAAAPEVELSLAEVFPLGVPDPPTGPRVVPDEATDAEPPHDLADDQWTALVEYLTFAEVVLRADGLAQDLVTGEADAVPVDLRSDGRWVWSDASVYYLLRHGLPLDEDFLAHVLERDGDPPTLDGVVHHRVLAYLGAGPVPAGDEADR